MMKFREDFTKFGKYRLLTLYHNSFSIYDDLWLNYMPKKMMAVVPEYVKTDNFGKTSFMWLEYMSKNDTNIQRALSGGEKS